MNLNTVVTSSVEMLPLLPTPPRRGSNEPVDTFEGAAEPIPAVPPRSLNALRRVATVHLAPVTWDTRDANIYVAAPHTYPTAAGQWHAAEWTAFATERTVLRLHSPVLRQHLVEDSQDACRDLVVVENALPPAVQRMLAQMYHRAGAAPVTLDDAVEVRAVTLRYYPDNDPETSRDLGDLIACCDQTIAAGLNANTAANLLQRALGPASDEDTVAAVLQLAAAQPPVRRALAALDAPNLRYVMGHIKLHGLSADDRAGVVADWARQQPEAGEGAATCMQSMEALVPWRQVSRPKLEQLFKAGALSQERVLQLVWQAPDAPGLGADYDVEAARPAAAPPAAAFAAPAALSAWPRAGLGAAYVACNAGTNAASGALIVLGAKLACVAMQEPWTDSLGRNVWSATRVAGAFGAVEAAIASMAMNSMGLFRAPPLMQHAAFNVAPGIVFSGFVAVGIGATWGAVQALEVLAGAGPTLSSGLAVGGVLGMLAGSVGMAMFKLGAYGALGT